MVVMFTSLGVGGGFVRASRGEAVAWRMRWIGRSKRRAESIVEELAIHATGAENGIAEC